MFHPRLFFIFFIAYLIHYVKGVATVRENGLIKAHGSLDGIQRIGNVFRGDADFTGNFLYGGLFQMLLRESLFGIDGFVSGIF